MPAPLTGRSPAPGQEIHVAIFLEDPGAANFALPIVHTAIAERIAPILFAAGPCQVQIRHAGLDFAPGEDAVGALDQCDVLIVGTGEDPASLAHRLVEAARDAGIPTVGLVDCQPNADRRFRGATDDPLAHVPDWLLVPDEATRDAYVALGFDPAQGRGCRAPAL